MNLSKEVIEHERIKTTEAKAKAVKPEIEKLITLAKRGDLHARRQALRRSRQDKFVVHKLFEEVAPRYAERPGGYTRILKLGPRRSGLDRDGLARARLRQAGPRLGARGLPREQGRTKLVLGYDGTAFSGWAAQPGMRTVESELVHAAAQGAPQARGGP